MFSIEYYYLLILIVIMTVFDFKNHQIQSYIIIL